jgi:hypothetical protein
MAERDLRPNIGRSKRSELGICSHQGPDGTCAYHAIAKILVKNVCGKLVNLTMTPEEKTMYQKCLSDSPIETEEELRSYTPEVCTKKGFISIMFFYYFYFYLKRNDYKFLKDAIPLLDTMQPRAAALSPLDSSLFSEVVQMMKDKKEGLTWRPILIKVEKDTYQNIIKNVLEPIGKLGLYVYMMLKGHGVVLMNSLDRHFLIQNSWGYQSDAVPYGTDGTDIRLQSDDKVFEIQYLELFLPMKTTFSEENQTHEVYTNNDPLHVRDLYPFIKKYVASQTGGRKRTRRRRSKHYTRFVRLRQ